MSRAYKIKIKESARHVLRASDHVSTQLELLEILPPERMADLLANELAKRGFKTQGEKLTRGMKDVVVEIDPIHATVMVRAETKQTVTIEGERQTWSERPPEGKQQEHEREKLRQQLLDDLQRQAEAQKAKLQQQVADQLEAVLTDLRKELNAAVNRVTADALKEKAAQMGQIKSLTEDETGSLTIVLEV